MSVSNQSQNMNKENNEDKSIPKQIPIIFLSGGPGMKKNLFEKRY